MHVIPHWLCNLSELERCKVACCEIVHTLLWDLQFGGKLMHSSCYLQEPL